MQRLVLGWLWLLGPIALSAGACGGDAKSSPSARATAGSGGAGADSGATTGGIAPVSGAFSGGEGTVAEGGNGEQNGLEGGAAGVGSAPTQAGGAGGAPVEPGDDCDAPVALSILGDYAQPNGDELWLRDSGAAVTLTRLPAGKPLSAQPPELWLVARACPEESTLLLQTSAGDFTRLDYLRGNASLTVCLSSATADTAALALALPHADATNTLDGGCNGGPWTRFVKGAL